MIDTTVKVDFDFEEPISAPGLYNLSEAAIDKLEPLLLF